MEEAQEEAEAEAERTPSRLPFGVAVARSRDASYLARRSGSDSTSNAADNAAHSSVTCAALASRALTLGRLGTLP